MNMILLAINVCRDRQQNITHRSRVFQVFFLIHGVQIPVGTMYQNVGDALECISRKLGSTKFPDHSSKFSWLAR